MSATQGAWVCRHGIDGRDYCEECCPPDDFVSDRVYALRFWLVLSMVVTAVYAGLALFAYWLF